MVHTELTKTSFVHPCNIRQAHEDTKCMKMGIASQIWKTLGTGSTPEKIPAPEISFLGWFSSRFSSSNQSQQWTKTHLGSLPCSLVAVLSGSWPRKPRNCPLKALGSWLLQVGKWDLQSKITNNEDFCWSPRPGSRTSFVDSFDTNTD